MFRASLAQVRENVPCRPFTFRCKCWNHGYVLNRVVIVGDYSAADGGRDFGLEVDFDTDCKYVLFPTDRRSDSSDLLFRATMNLPERSEPSAGLTRVPTIIPLQPPY